MPQAGTDSEPLGDDPDVLRRRIRELELENALMREVVEARRKRPRRRPAAPVEQGEDDAGRPAEAEVFAEVDGLLAAHVLLQFFLSNFCTVFPQHRLLVSSGNCTV